MRRIVVALLLGIGLVGGHATLARAMADRAALTETPAALACIPPANDDFAGVAGIGAVPFTTTLSAACATSQVNEPRPCASIGSTVWYSFTASASGTLQADTIGSDYDTALALYTGADLAHLSSVACDDDSGPGLVSLVTFAAVSGTTYRFQVGGFAGSTGTLHLQLAPPAPTPTPTDTPAPTMTPTPCPACTPTETATSTPTSVRPMPTAYIDETVNSQQGPITATLGDVVTYQWVVTCDCTGRAFTAYVHSSLYETLLGGTFSCASSGCQTSASVKLLTPGPVTDTVTVDVCPIPPSPSCGPASDYVKVNVVTGIAVGGIAEDPAVAALSSHAAPGGRSYAVYILGATVALIVAAAGAGVWRKRRE